MIAEPRRTLFRPSPLQIFLIASSFLLAIYLMVHTMTARPGHDQSWCLFGGARLLDGAQPYGPLLVETNPPLILWLSAIPILLARSLHADPTAVLRILVLLAIFGSSFWCVRLLRRTLPSSHPAFAPLLGCFVLLILLHSGYDDFGQREHLFVVFCLPYLLASATSSTLLTGSPIPVAERIAMGIAAGIAISLKPHETIVIVFFELFLVLITRSLRRLFCAEFITLVLTCVTYVAVVRLFSPLYQTQILPLLFDAYWAFGPVSALTLALSLKKLYLGVLLVAAVCFALRRYIDRAEVVYALLLCALAASIAYDIQHIAWFYHRLPCQMFLLLAAAWIAVDLLLLLDRRYVGQLRFALPLICCLLVLECAVLLMNVRSHHRIETAEDTPLDRILSQYPPATTVYVFSTNLGSFAAVYEHHLNWGSRFAHLWLVPAIVENEQPAAHPPAVFKRLSAEQLAHLTQVQRTESTEDLDRWKPSVVLVRHCAPDRPCMALEGRTFDTLGWFLEDPAFASAWSHYELQTSGPDYDVYARVR